MRDFDILIVFPLPVLNPDLTLPGGTGVVAALPLPLLLLPLLLLPLLLLLLRLPLLFDVPTAPVAAASAASVTASITSPAVASAAVRVGPRGSLAVDGKPGEAAGKTAGVSSDPCESFLRMGDTGGEAGSTTVWSASSSSPSPFSSPSPPASPRCHPPPPRHRRSPTQSVQQNVSAMHRPVSVAMLVVVAVPEPGRRFAL